MLTVGRPSRCHFDTAMSSRLSWLRITRASTGYSLDHFLVLVVVVAHGITTLRTNRWTQCEAFFLGVPSVNAFAAGKIVFVVVVVVVFVVATASGNNRRLGSGGDNNHRRNHCLIVVCLSGISFFSFREKLVFVRSSKPFGKRTCCRGLHCANRS